MVEADESDRSFLRYRPYVVDHHQHRRRPPQHLRRPGRAARPRSLEFCRLTEPAGFVVTCADDPGDRAAGRAGSRGRGPTVYTYGEAPDADLRLTEMRLDRHRRALPGHARRRGAGRDQRCRCPAGTWAQLGGRGADRAAARRAVDQVVEALASFPGVRRRFELKGIADGVRVYDEYAYHPTSMTAALETLREVAGDGRLIVVFQPYRMYRTRDFQAEIAAALAIADEAVILEVFGPGEVREPGEGGVALTAAVDLPPGTRSSCRPGTTCRARWCAGPATGDVVVTMGAPPISLMGDELLAALAGAAGARAAGAPPRDREPGRSRRRTRCGGWRRRDAPCRDAVPASVRRFMRPGPPRADPRPRGRGLVAAVVVLVVWPWLAGRTARRCSVSRASGERRDAGRRRPRCAPRRRCRPVRRWPGWTPTRSRRAGAARCRAVARVDGRAAYWPRHAGRSRWPSGRRWRRCPPGGGSPCSTRAGVVVPTRWPTRPAGLPLVRLAEPGPGRSGDRGPRWRCWRR